MRDESYLFLNLSIFVCTSNVSHIFFEIVFGLLDFLIGSVFLKTTPIDLLTVDCSASIFYIRTISKGEIVLIIELYFIGKGMSDSLFFEFHYLFKAM